MLSKRELQQRMLGCISASLLLHGGVGVAVAMSGGSTQTKSLKEQPAAVYIQEADTGMPKGEQTESLPPAPEAQKTAEVEDVKPTETAQALPVKTEEKKAAPVVEKALPAKKQPTKVVTQTLPAKKGKPTETESDAKAAVTAARAEESAKEVETSDDSQTAVVAPLAGEEESASAMTAPQETEAAPVEEPAPEAAQPEEEAAVEPVAAIAPVSEQKQTAQATQQEAATAQAKEQAQKQNQSRASETQGAPGGRGASQTDATKPYGIRDATELREGAGNRKPVYPDNDRLARNQGVAVFVAKVRPDGTVTDIRFEKQTTSKSLNESALAAMKNWRFQPGQEGWVRKSFTFSLGGDTQEMPARLRR